VNAAEAAEKRLGKETTLHFLLAKSCVFTYQGQYLTQNDIRMMLVPI